MVAVAVCVAGAVAGVACSGSDGDDEPGQITRIDGPATVDEDDAGADQDGAPPPASGSVSGSSGEIIDGS